MCFVFHVVPCPEVSTYALHGLDELAFVITQSPLISWIFISVKISFVPLLPLWGVNLPLKLTTSHKAHIRFQRVNRCVLSPLEITGKIENQQDK